MDKLRHLWKPYILGCGADIICLQELIRCDFDELMSQTNYYGTFVPSIDVDQSYPTQQGIAILTKAKITKSHFYYFGDRVETGYDLTSCALLIVSFTSKRKKYIIGTTHFTWTPAGESSDFQKRSLDRLIACCRQYPRLVIAGDFNAPRGRETFSKLATNYRDWVPHTITSTIDGSLHSAGQLPYVVDGIFSTSHYWVKNVKLIKGVSDHCALEAQIGESYG